MRQNNARFSRANNWQGRVFPGEVEAGLKIPFNRNGNEMEMYVKVRIKLICDLWKASAI